MKTITVQIGNSDDKLTQVQWSAFFNATENIIHKYATEVHFTGASVSWSAYQNACFVCVCADYMTDELKKALSIEGKRFSQDSIAYSEGATEFI